MCPRRPSMQIRLTAFRDFLLQCSLMDLESKGCAFTLLKNEGDEWVKEEEPLKEITAAFFKNLYTSVGTRNFQPDPLCPICQKEAETIEHTLLLCPWTAIIWQDNSLVVYMARPQPLYLRRKGPVETPAPRLIPSKH